MAGCTIDHYHEIINIKISPAMPRFIDLSTKMEVKRDLGTPRNVLNKKFLFSLSVVECERDMTTSAYLFQ